MRMVIITRDKCGVRADDFGTCNFVLLMGFVKLIIPKFLVLEFYVVYEFHDPKSKRSLVILFSDSWTYRQTDTQTHRSTHGSIVAM